MSDVTGIFVYLTAHVPCTKSLQKIITNWMQKTDRLVEREKQ